VEETAYVDSFESSDTFVVDDREAIRDLARVVSAAVYDPAREGQTPHVTSIETWTRVAFRCYLGNEEVTSFLWLTTHIVCDGHWFQTDKRGPSLSMLTPQIQPLRLRCYCAYNLRNLNGRFSWYRGINRAYPPADTWCDAFVTYYAGGGYTMAVSNFAGEVTCPAAGEGRAHYAMNVNCEPNSPSDMVLLFETKAGWNQHGGPELFTFDNHDPKGGCVLLNGGPVKFIRTEEELKQLRWK